MRVADHGMMIGKLQIKRAKLSTMIQNDDQQIQYHPKVKHKNGFQTLGADPVWVERLFPVETHISPVLCEQ